MVRWLVVLFSMLILMVSYQLRDLNWTGLLLYDTNPVESAWMFIVNKSIRYLINDLAALALIWGLFYRTDFVKQAFWIFFIGLVGLLPAYFISHFYFADTLGVTLSYLHRLVMNPTLMMLLIPLFYFQQKVEKTQSS